MQQHAYYCYWVEEETHQHGLEIQKSVKSDYLIPPRSITNNRKSTGLRVTKFGFHFHSSVIHVFYFRSTLVVFTVEDRELYSIKFKKPTTFNLPPCGWLAFQIQSIINSLRQFIFFFFFWKAWHSIVAPANLFLLSSFIIGPHVQFSWRKKKF